jgi:hypothetical protein
MKEERRKWFKVLKIIIEKNIQSRLDEKQFRLLAGLIILETEKMFSSEFPYLAYKLKLGTTTGSLWIIKKTLIRITENGKIK